MATAADDSGQDLFGSINHVSCLDAHWKFNAELARILMHLLLDLRVELQSCPKIN